MKKLKKILKLLVGLRVQLTDNLDVEDKLCNGSEGTVKYTHILTTTSKDVGTIYVQFDNKKSGKKRKSNSLPEELENCVPVQVKARKFSYSLYGKSKSNLIFSERKQFPIVLAHASTMHKTQGSTINHMTVDLDTTTKRAGKHPCLISRGLVYTLLS